VCVILLLRICLRVVFYAIFSIVFLRADGLTLYLSVTNNFYVHTGLQKKECHAFIVDGIQVGLVRATVTIELSRYPNVFIVKPNSVTLNPAFRDYDERSANIESVLKDMKDKMLFITLKGWRDEVLTQASY